MTRRTELSSAAKAEILAAVLHELEHMPKVWDALSAEYKTSMSCALRDCSIDVKDLSEEDLRNIRAWFKEKKGSRK